MDPTPELGLMAKLGRSERERQAVGLPSESERLLDELRLRQVTAEWVTDHVDYEPPHFG
jgi:hypothetical protein